MPKIKANKPFTVVLQDHTQRNFLPGEHDIEDSLAAHWYVKANSEPVVEAEPAAEPEPATDEPAASPRGEDSKKKTAKK